METKEMRFNELKDKLKKAGQIGFDVKTPFKYVPEFYRKEENEIPKDFWPVFILKSKNGLEIAKAEDDSGSMYLDKGETARMNLNTGTQRIKTLKHGIISVKNFYTEEGEIIEFSKGGKLIIKDAETGEEKNSKLVEDSEKLIPYLSAKLQVELQNAINERSQITEEELQGL